MKPNEINDWLAVITNIGVIIGLGFVVYEVRLTNAALDREQLSHLTEVNTGEKEALRTWMYSLIENPEVAELWIRGNAQADLSEADQLRFSLMTADTISRWRMQYDQYTAVGYEPADWVINIIMRDAMKSSPAMLPALKANMESDPTVDLFQRIVEINPPWFKAE